MKFSLSRYPIDWPNHLIGFFSALFGILIAFELEEWRDQRNQVEVANVAFENLKKEIEINQSGFHGNISGNLRRIATLQSISTKLDEHLLFTGKNSEADSINLNYDEVIFIEQSGSGSKERPTVHIGLGSLIIPTLQSSAWESAKATGALNLMNYEKVLPLSFLYNPSRISEELAGIRNLLRNADDISSRSELTALLKELEKAHRSIARELAEFDQFVNIVNAME